MNSQDFRALQEAYLEVVSNQLDERVLGQDPESRKEDSKERKSGSKRLSPYSGEKYAKTQSQHISYMDKLTKNKKIIPGMANEEFDEQVELYDIILSHLLDEGYADTEDSALVIMANMSEDWRESICEDYKPWDFGPKQKAKRKYDQLVKDKAAGNSPPGTATRANKIASVAKDMRTTLDKNSASTGTNPAKQGLQPATRRHTAAALRGAGGGMTASKTYDVKPLNRR